MKKLSIFFSFLFLFTFFFVGSTYAADIELPPVPDVDLPYNQYIIYEATPDGMGNRRIYLKLFSSSNPLTNSKAYLVSSDLVKYEILDDTTVYTEREYLYKADTNSWHLSSTTSKDASAYSIVYQYIDLFEADFNVYRSLESEEIFFQGPPVVAEKTLEETLAEEIPATQEKIFQAMKIILLCGVGCLALLIGLSLFGKVFRIFQVK